MLSFEEFKTRNIKGIPRYNNFYGYFATGSFIGMVYQGKEHYLRFVSEHPEKAEALVKRVTEEVCHTKKQASESLEKELYEAYQIMSDYGVSDEDLFS